MWTERRCAQRRRIRWVCGERQQCAGNVQGDAATKNRRRVIENGSYRSKNELPFVSCVAETIEKQNIPTSFGHIVWPHCLFFAVSQVHLVLHEASYIALGGQRARGLQNS